MSSPVRVMCVHDKWHWLRNESSFTETSEYGITQAIQFKSLVHIYIASWSLLIIINIISWTYFNHVLTLSRFLLIVINHNSVHYIQFVSHFTENNTYDVPFGLIYIWLKFLHVTNARVFLSHFLFIRCESSFVIPILFLTHVSCHWYFLVKNINLLFVVRKEMVERIK